MCPAVQLFHGSSILGVKADGGSGPTGAPAMKKGDAAFAEPWQRGIYQAAGPLCSSRLCDILQLMSMYRIGEIEMKRALLSVVFFIVSFAAAYLIMCYLPCMRIRLAAEPMEYFVESIKHNMGIKILVSSLCGLLICSVPMALAKRTK